MNSENRNENRNPILTSASKVKQERNLTQHTCELGGGNPVLDANMLLEVSASS